MYVGGGWGAMGRKPPTAEPNMQISYPPSATGFSSVFLVDFLFLLCKLLSVKDGRTFKKILMKTYVLKN